MNSNPFLGVVFHWIGGLASGSFYVPFRGVRKWSWETYWLTGGVFSWIIAPWFFGLLLTNGLVDTLTHAPHSTMFWAYFFGLLWGFGGLTFGLTMRYLGMSLGMAVALGYTAAFGTLVPPIFQGEFASKVLGTSSGRVILVGVCICLVGIAVAGAAGVSKEREMSAEQKQSVIKEFNLRKGLIVATFSGVMSACFSYGLAAGDPIRALTLAHGTPALWQGLPVLVVVLFGGFTTNAIWCLTLNARNKTGDQYFSSTPASLGGRVPMIRNYFLSGLAGVIWYFQFFFYTMGETQMGKYQFSSWTLHMASIIIFSTLWGIALKEWDGSGRRTKLLVALSLIVLVGSTIIVGYGNYLGR
jgi:L-rhamnose-H+ transport protein